jgi:capping protein alpha
MEVVTDIRGLLGGRESILNDSAPQTFRDHNTNQMVIVDVKGNKVLITKQGEVGDGEYLDPRGKQVVLYDHIRQTVTGTRPLSGELEQSIESTRAAFDEAVKEYTDNFYPAPMGASSVYASGKTITICISSAKFNSQNFWNGSWRVVWTCTLSGSNVELKGNFKITAHYYEDGNVQLNTNTDKSLSVPAGSNPKDTAQKTIAAIKKVEVSFQEALNTSYATMGDTTFKALRRALPITRKKLDWQKIRTYKLGAQVVGPKQT